MCGITGWFSTSELKNQQSRLKKMMAAIAHRGPDGQGSYLSPHAALGHVRLSIIDIDAGQQPISRSQRYQIIFNGEIYNYQSLRNDLIQLGYRFKTHTDTEVILVLYIHYGDQAFSKLRGMFALAIWDNQTGSARLVRDSAGIKPLFYHQKPNGELIFASEAKSILVKENQLETGLDENALHQLMNFRYLPDDLSLFKQIKQLKPGTILSWNQQGKVQFNSFHYQTDTSNDIYHEFELSCQMHLTADVEVACYLSGGIDSASITACAAKHLGNNLKTFTLNAGDDPNEARYAARTAEQLQVENYQTDFQSNIAEQLPTLLWHLEVPKINSIQISQIAQFAASKVKVVLSGLGGDELFLGYNAHKIMQQAQTASHVLPFQLNRLLAQSFNPLLNFTHQPLWSELERANLMLSALGDWPHVYGLLRNIWDRPDLRQKIYGERILDNHPQNSYELIRDQWNHKAAHPLQAMAEFEWNNKMVNDLLWQEDRCSMAVGLEVRVPFLDPALATQVKKLSINQLMPAKQPKGYFKQLIKPLLTDEIMHRPKSGFQVNAPVFFNQYLNTLADEWLSPDKVTHFQLFNPEFVKTVRSYPQNRQLRWHYFMLYLMLLTHIWLDQFEQGNHP